MKSLWANLTRVGAATLIVLALASAGYFWSMAPDRSAAKPNNARFTKTAGEASTASIREDGATDPRYVDFDPLIFWWDSIPDNLREVAIETGPQSNMHFDDYVGPDACQECHKKNYDQWSQHPHRWMNAKATSETVRGDFSGAQKINYLGGEATFYAEQARYRMKLVRDGDEFIYEVHETIGSRFFQYYIGRLVSGRFGDDHVYRTTNHVLPFGFWLSREQWVPVVHVGRERPDGGRDDPFAPPDDPQAGIDFSPYAANCNMCHTTFALADNLTRKPRQLAKHAPERLHWDMAAYFERAHPELWQTGVHPSEVATDDINRIPEILQTYEADQHAVTLGVSCEACHLGCKDHVKNPKSKPSFHPRSPLLYIQNATGTLETGRTHQNVNWACARCHVGERPQFAAGMSTWNSVEYSDAMLGSCYSQLKCIDCHSPHQATGQQWTKSAQEDDASCIKCHAKYESEAELVAHTHHDATSNGSRCMNCHMPKLNEGLQAVVRTHTIFSPTNKAMIEANHPNACNLCHTEQSIDWTLQNLKQWYGATYSEAEIAKAYPDRNESVAANWMKSENEAVRQVAAFAVCETKDKSLLPKLIEMLDDPYLLNRQFALIGIEEMLQDRLDRYGYQFYMTDEERAEPLRAIRAALIPAAP